jgi:hypothetical protein
MPRERCLITSRLAGPCATCRQPAWPAHVQTDGRIVCGHCCPCAPRDAAPAGAAAEGGRSGPAQEVARARAAGRAIAPAGPGKAPDTTPPVPRDSGALRGAARAIICGDLLGAAAPAGLSRALLLLAASGATMPPRGCPTIRLTLTAPGRPARRCRGFRASARGRQGLALPPAACRPPAACLPAGATTWPGRTRCHAARPDAAQAGAWPQCRPPWPPRPRLAHASWRRTSRQKHFFAGMFRLQSHLEAEL